MVFFFQAEDGIRDLTVTGVQTCAFPISVIDFYMENARLIREGLEAAGLTVYGGRNAPYIWVKTPAGLDSWGFFDKLLNEAHVGGTPRAGFGRSGEGYFPLTRLRNRASTREAGARIKSRLQR